MPPLFITVISILPKKRDNKENDNTVKRYIYLFALCNICDENPSGLHRCKSQKYFSKNY